MLFLCFSAGAICGACLGILIMALMFIARQSG